MTQAAQMDKFYSIRSKAARSDQKDVLRVMLPHAMMATHRLESEDLCRLRTEDGGSYLAIAWPEKRSDNVIVVTKEFQALHGLTDRHKLSIQRQESETQVEAAVTIELVIDSADEIDVASNREHWAWLMHDPLYSAEMLTPGMSFQYKFEYKRRQPKFWLHRINSVAADGIYRFVEKTTVTIVDIANHPGEGGAHRLHISGEDIGGLHQQIQRLNLLLRNYSHTADTFTHKALMRNGLGGLLLHGPSGTGKTLLLRRLEKAQWKRTFVICLRTAKSQDIRKAFSDARRSCPSMISIDNLELLSNPESTTASNIVAVLNQEFERLGDARVLVVGATSNLHTLDNSLRRVRTLSHEVELPVPDTAARAAILKVLNDLPPSEPDAVLDDLAERTHGYVGADLDKLVTLAAHTSLTAHLDAEEASTSTPATGGTQYRTLTILPSAYESALLITQPSSMSDIFLETPKTRWTDIGGSSHIKTALQQAIGWPLKHPLTLSTLMTAPFKGVLLYGPPGCSKTLTARAVATEAGLNFLCVKGAELLNMYVGESERGVREVFRKARAAAPSILFFDEVDAIGGRRAEMGGGAAASGLNVLTTLLNELDGIEALRSVFVLAATNAPQSLDPALMRPGRLDQLLYVGLPDRESREEILKITMDRVRVAEGVDRAWLAETTEGHTGAELVNVCQKAGRAAMEEAVALIEGGDHQTIISIDTEHFERALAEVPRQVTEEMIGSYEQWSKSMMS